MLWLVQLVLVMLVLAQQQRINLLMNVSGTNSGNLTGTVTISGKGTHK